MDTNALASRLNLTAKNLRRYLRRNPELLEGLAEETDASGRRRYEFTEEDYENIREAMFKADEAGRKERIELTLDPPMPLKDAIAVFRDPRARMMAQSKYAARTARLQERLRTSETM